MLRWRFGLQLRLILGFAAVLALSMAAAAVCTGFAANREVSRIQVEQDHVRANRIHVALAEYYAANAGWSDVQDFVNRTSFQSEREIVVLDGAGTIVADSRKIRHGHGDADRHHLFRFDGRAEPLPPARFFTAVVSENVTVGSVLVGTRARGDLRPMLPIGSEVLPPDVEPPLARFAQTVGRSLVLAGLFAGAAGIILVLLLSRRMLRSVRSLTTAARTLGGGDLSTRAEVRGNDEIAELGHTFNAMADALEDSERQRRTMVSDVAHELRTPLANIQGHIEAMQDGLMQPDPKNLDTVHQQTLHLNHLISDLRLLAQTEARELPLSLEPTSIAEIVNEVSESFRPRAETASIRLSAEIDDGLPTLMLDRLRIRQVLGNLVDNALRHTPPDGTVTLSAQPRGDRVRIAVSDTGPGIPPDSLPHVFDRLYRVDSSRDRTSGGSGLGLTIARQLVEAHGGAIWAESNPGQGSRFGFDLLAMEH